MEARTVDGLRVGGGAVGIFVACVFDIIEVMHSTISFPRSFVGDGDAAVLSDGEAEERSVVNEPVDALLLKEEVMARLRCGEKALRGYVASGKLPAVKFGRTSPLRFRQIDVARFIERSATANTNQQP